MANPTIDLISPGESCLGVKSEQSSALHIFLTWYLLSMPEQDEVDQTRPFPLTRYELSRLDRIEFFPIHTRV